jgi:hypothetical protein
MTADGAARLAGIRRSETVQRALADFMSRFLNAC